MNTQAATGSYLDFHDVPLGLIFGVVSFRVENNHRVWVYFISFSNFFIKNNTKVIIISVVIS